jgi:hypothetical protein
VLEQTKNQRQLQWMAQDIVKQHLGGGLAAGVGCERSRRTWLATASVGGQQRKQWGKAAAAGAAGESNDTSVVVFMPTYCLG